MLVVCALLILGIFKNNQVFGHGTLGHLNIETIDFSMRHSRLDRALVGRNSLKIFLIQFPLRY